MCKAALKAKCKHGLQAVAFVHAVPMCSEELYDYNRERGLQ